MHTIIFCPHQDDEILSSFHLISRLRENGEHVTIVFATNGDYYGKALAKIRYMESVQALSFCHIEQSDIIYMGYGDTGMRRDHSFLYRLYHADKEQPFTSGCSKYTYHPAGLETIHHILFRENVSYTKAHFIDDLKAIFHMLAPDRLIVPSVLDEHGDHHALAKFILQAAPELYRKSYFYMIHSGDDLSWPPRNTSIWTCPPTVPDEMWKNRIIIKNEALTTAKLHAIQCFKSQKPYDLNEFLVSFSKPEEIFFCCHPTINRYFPTE